MIHPNPDTVLGSQSWLPAFLGGIVGTLVLLLLTLLLSVIILRRRRRNSQRLQREAVKQILQNNVGTDDDIAAPVIIRNGNTQEIGER